MARTSFFKQDTSYSPRFKREIKAWIKQTILAEGKIPGDISIIHCSDEYLLAMNKQFLQHDYYTDVITFDYGEGEIVSGDIFISIDRVKENASKLGVSPLIEDRRIIIHGVLHLIGYQDKTKLKKSEMTVLEDRYLSLYLTNNQGKKEVKNTK